MDMLKGNRQNTGKVLLYHLNNPGRPEPVLLFSATNFTNFPLFFVLIVRSVGRQYTQIRG